MTSLLAAAAPASSEPPLLTSVPLLPILLAFVALVSVVMYVREVLRSR